ncbi:CHASE domain-containing protein [Duganella violaceipulchra]|uniref:Signal transduction histidine kinase n=1 Tax=Duganella violaceipulchra TaxID=2849652 RepID=A0ABT1GSM6_9BURK|nr:CHASE domain-containing protein [Duganella violaceicalia]MCP2010523.1 signal transduction histidine kinase [Duganella violaceicalia]
MVALLAQKQLFSPTKPVWWAGVLLSLGIGALFYVMVYKTIEHDAAERFTQQARNAQYNITSRINAYTDVLRGTASFFDASDRVDRASFHRYVNGLDLGQQFPALDNINFTQRVTDAQRDAFERAAARSGDGQPDGYPNFTIKPAGRRDEYSVLTMIEPIAPYRHRLGIDISAREQAARAIVLARDTGQLITSGMPIENTRNSQGWALAMRLPLYRKDVPLTDVAQRRAAYIGSVGIGFSVPRLVRAAMDQMQVREVHLMLYDDGRNADGSVSPLTLLYDNSATARHAAHRDDQFAIVLPLDFNGRQWSAHFSAPKAVWYSRFDAFLPWLAMACGFVGSLLFYLLFHTLSSSRMRAIKMAKAMTKELRDSQAKLQLSHHKLRQLAAHADQIKEQERKRIAREIHDDLGQNLLVLRIEADLLASRTRQNHPRLHARARSTLTQIDSTIKSVRHIINDLRPTVLDLGLNAAVEWQIAQFRQRSGMVCELIEHQSDIRIDDRCATAFFRVLQESLSNILQHARASLVRVELCQAGGMLSMTISDNGVGLRESSRNKVGSFGLVGIEERISLLGGHCAITGGHNAGTTVTISVPVDYVPPPGADDYQLATRLAADAPA